MNELTDELKKQFILPQDELFNLYKFGQIGKPKAEVKEELLRDLEWLHTSTGKHASVDTLAKKLYLTKKPKELFKLKLALSAFFVLEELKGKTDYRYDAFYASILKILQPLFLKT